MCDGGVRYTGQLTGIFIRPLATRTYMHKHTTERERENPLLVSSIRRLSCVERMRFGKTPGTRVATCCFRRNSLYCSSTPAQLEVLCLRTTVPVLHGTDRRPFAFLLRKFTLGKWEKRESQIDHWIAALCDSHRNTNILHGVSRGDISLCVCVCVFHCLFFFTPPQDVFSK